MREQVFDYNIVAKFILCLFANSNYIIALDRTCWKFGKTDINILFLVIVIGKISVPIYWHMLGSGGACSSDLMKEMLRRFIDNFGSAKIKYLLADREFMSKEWLAFLKQTQVIFAIPLKKDVKIRLYGKVQILPVGKSFNQLKQNEYMLVKGVLWNHDITFAAYKNDKSELMVIASSADLDVDIFALYRYRWSIERLFKHLKTAGFDIEKSHITDLDRFAKLIAICAISCALIVKNGILQEDSKPIRMKKFKDIDIKRPLFSFFTYGLDHLQHSLSHASLKTLNYIIKMILIPLDIPTSYILSQKL